MMAGNPNWSEKNFAACCVNESHLRSSSQFVYGESNSSNLSSHDDHLNPVRSNWRQLLLGGEEEDRYGASLFQQQKKLENWEDQVYLNLNPSFTTTVVDVKQEIPQYHHLHNHSNSNWLPHHHHHHQVSSPTSCITTLSNSIFNFSGAHKPPPPPAEAKNRRHNQDHSSECNSTSTGGVSKKARIQHSSAQPALKVRKEKLGDRITALHQLVSPFGKTDTASVLSEAIGYIRFLQGQIEALSSPYMRNASGSSTVHHQHSDLQISQEGENDLKSRGLCLVPISCTQNVGNDNGADYWAPAALGGGF